MKSTLIKDALILDGSGTAPYKADLRIVGNEIAQIGKVLPAGNSVVLDASNLFICPGFIDMHSHADLALLKEPVPDQKIRQGVTTELLGQDGLGVAPCSERSLADLQEIISGLQGRLGGMQWTWRSFAEYLDRLERSALPNNTAVLATHAPLRLEVIGMQKRTAGDRELAEMGRLLEACLDAGGFGLSSGLEYPPQYNADQRELAELNKIVARYGGIYVVHQRNEGTHLKESFEEQLSVGRDSGVHLHISHLKAWGPDNWHLIDPVLDAAQAYQESGGAITWDRYPYLSGSTLLGIILPHWAWAEGAKNLIQDLSQERFRERLRAAYRLDPEQWEHDPGSIGWENLFISGITLPEHQWMVGRNISDLSKQSGKDEVDLVCDLLASERLAVTAIFFYGSEDVLNKVLTHPLACVGSDGVLLGNPHPRLYGSFPLFIEKFALRNKILSLPEAVRKITSLPAEILGLKKRGQLKEGWYADIVAFDPDKLHAPVDYNKTDQYPQGIEHVFLNGEWVVNGGIFNGQLKGRLLRKGD